MKNTIYALMIALCAYISIHSAEREHEPKALILIVASDDYPIYTELQKFWRLYMHSDPDHIEVYFVKSDPNLPTKVQVVGDTIWCQTPDGFCYQNCGIITKTLYALEHFLPKIQNEFDYVMRTNLSTFCIFPRFLNYLKKLPKTRCYAGTDIRNTGAASGTGIILSPDLVELLIEREKEVLRFLPDHCIDDVTIADFFHSQGIQLIPHNLRTGVYSFSEWEQLRGAFPPQPFQVHVNTAWQTNNYLFDRLVTDKIVHSELLNMFYPWIPVVDVARELLDEHTSPDTTDIY